VDRVAAYLDGLDADIIHLAEVHDCATLEQLLARMQLGDEYSAHLVPGLDTATGQNVALLTRIDPTEPLWRVNARTAYPLAGGRCGFHDTGENRSVITSKHLFARFTLRAGYGTDSADLADPPVEVRVLLVGAHLLAHPTDPLRCVKREAQAQNLIGEIRAQLHADEHLVVLGDLNDYDADLRDAAGSLPTSRVLSSLRELRLLGERADASSTQRTVLHREQEHTLEQQARDAPTTPTYLQNVFAVAQERAALGPLLPQDTYSAWWDKNKNNVDDGREEHTSIDHILLSGGLVNATVLVEYEHQLYTQGTSDLNSDHWPLLVELDLRAVSPVDNSGIIPQPV
jgi:exonuclease III